MESHEILEGIPVAQRTNPDYFHGPLSVPMLQSQRQVKTFAYPAVDLNISTEWISNKFLAWSFTVLEMMNPCYFADPLIFFCCHSAPTSLSNCWMQTILTRMNYNYLLDSFTFHQTPTSLSKTF